MLVSETFQVKAPFFVHANVEHWRELTLPTNISTLDQLEFYLDSLLKKVNKPVFFRLSGTVQNGQIHILNLPEGAMGEITGRRTSGTAELSACK